MDTEKVKYVRKRDYLVNVLLIVFWLIPLAYTGGCGKTVPYFGKYLNYSYGVAALFTTKMTYWKNLYVQIKTNENPEWVIVDEYKYFPMNPFGHRTRLSRGYNHSFRFDAARHKGIGKSRRKEIAEFIRSRYEQDNPGIKVTEMRFIHVLQYVGEPELADPKGHWEQPPLSTFPEARWKVMSTHKFSS